MCVSHKHTHTQPSVVSNLPSGGAVRPDLEADRIRTGELDLINLVRLLTRLATTAGP